MASKKQRAARTVIDEAEEVFATPIATAPRTPEVTPHKRKLAEEFEADMADMSFSASSDVLTPIAKAMKKQTSGPVTFTLYFKAVRPGVNVPLGFGMFNTLDIRADLQQFVALEGGHHQPFFINEDILSKRRVSGWDSAWRIPAWFHAAYRTIETVEQLKPAMLDARNWSNILRDISTTAGSPRRVITTGSLLCSTASRSSVNACFASVIDTDCMPSVSRRCWQHSSGLTGPRLGELRFEHISYPAARPQGATPFDVRVRRQQGDRVSTVCGSICEGPRCPWAAHLGHAVDTLSDAEAVVRNLQSMSPAMTPLLLRIVHLVPAGKASTPRRRHAYGRIIEWTEPPCQILR